MTSPLEIEDMCNTYLTYKETISPNSIIYRINPSGSYEPDNLIEVPNTFVLDKDIHVNPVYICIYSTYLSIKAYPYGKLLDRDVYITRVLDKLKLTKFDPRMKKIITLARFYIYDRGLSEFRLPRHALNELKICLFEQNCELVEVYENSFSSKEIDIGINSGWKLREEQVPVVNWLVNSNVGTIRGTQLRTGGGKSLCATWSAVNIKKTTLIICSGLLDQWEQNILNITNIDKDDIFVIKGFPSLKKLFKEHRSYKVFIASIETLRSYITNQDGIYSTVPSYSQFLQEFEIGTKIIDEFHLNFSAIVRIDLHSNVENNLYLSATPQRSDRQANKIFNIVFPFKNIFGNTVHDKYVNTTMYRYRLDIPSAQRLINNYGYNHAKYEGIICNRSTLRLEYIKKVLMPVINAHYINKFTSGKCLILVQTVQFAGIIKDHLEFYFDNKCVNTFTAEDPIDNLYNSDIIISTPKSSGTGKDIKELCCCINTISLASEPLVKQIFGRLRKLPDGRTPEFVDLYNRVIPRQVSHAKTRKRIYQYISLRTDEFNL